MEMEVTNADNKMENLAAGMNFEKDQRNEGTEIEVIEPQYSSITSDKGGNKSHQSNEVVPISESLPQASINNEPDRTHKCSLCDSSFKGKKHLRQHMQTHSDLREFLCKYCDSKYKRKYDLIQHMRVHTGIVFIPF